MKMRDSRERTAVCGAGVSAQYAACGEGGSMLGRRQNVIQEVSCGARGSMAQEAACGGAEGS
jgi:hypothetical protein